MGRHALGLVEELGRAGLASKRRERAAVAAKTTGNDRVDRWIERAGTPRSAGLVIAYATTTTAVVAALLMKLIEPKEFSSVGSGFWWAVQTVTRVGYGDIVPMTAAGRIAASLVMLFGTAFLVVVTAVITSTFVARSRDSAGAETVGARRDQFRLISERLDAIEAALLEDT